MKVSFWGIYDVRFPQGTSDEYINKKYLDVKDYVDKKYNQNLDMIDVSVKDTFNTQYSDKKLADKGIRISTSIDNPWVLCDVFENMSKPLGQQYVDKAKVELVLDTIA